MKKVMQYYIVVFVMKGRKYFTIWYTDDKDGFVLNSEGRIEIFKTEIDVREFLQKKQMKPGEKVTFFDCDELGTMNYEHIDCSKVLDFWNIITDISYSVNEDFIGRTKSEEILNIYDKLFYGCNLPASNRMDEKYVPEWSAKEQMMISNVINDGLRIIEKTIGYKGDKI